MDTLMVGAAATLGVVISVLISYVVTRTAWHGRKALDIMAWGPWAILGLVMSLGFLWAFVWLPIYGTLWVVVWLCGARIAGRFEVLHQHHGVQLSAELEESARVTAAPGSGRSCGSGCPAAAPPLSARGSFSFVIAVRVLMSSCCWQDRARTLSVDIFL